MNFDSRSDYQAGTGTVSTATRSTASEQLISQRGPTIVGGNEAAPSASGHGNLQVPSLNMATSDTDELNPYPNDLFPQPWTGPIALYQHPILLNAPAPEQIAIHDNSLGAQHQNPVPSTEHEQQPVYTHDNSFNWNDFLKEMPPTHGSPGLIFSSTSAIEGLVNPSPQANTQSQVPLPTGLVASDLAPNPSRARQGFRENSPSDSSRRSRSPQVRPDVHNALKHNYQQAVSRNQRLEHEKRDLRRNLDHDSAALTALTLQNSHLRQQLEAANRKLIAIGQEVLNDDHQGQRLAFALRAILIDGGDAAQGSA